MKGKKTAGATFEALNPVDYFNLFIVCLYLLVDFIPKGDAIDFNGPQWLYLGIINLFVIIYLFASGSTSQHNYKTQFANVFFRAPLMLYGLYFIVSGFSFFFAFNQNEFWVCYARLIIAFIALINILIVLQKSEKLFPYVAQVIAIIVFFKSAEALQGFFSDVSTSGVSLAILNMKGDTGNKNIFSSGIIVKIPFVLFCIYNGKKIQRIINLAILVITLYTVFLASTRSAFISVFVEAFIYFIFCIYDFYDHKDGRTMVQQLGLFLIPIILGIFLSQVTVDTQRRITTEQTTQVYGTVTERLGTITLSDSSSSGRFHIWQAGISLFKDHPFTGIGYGNWKIASIPYERLDNNDNSVTVHAHNDFLESFGESGVLGGISYLLVFLLLPFLSLPNLFTKAIPNNKKILLLISLLGLAGYFIDAFLNFPMERATMQVYFVVLFALNINENYRLSVLRNERNTTSTKGRGIFRPYLVGALLLILPAVNITYQTWQSMIVQSTIFVDVNADVLTHKSYEVNDQFPALTNVTMWGLPISAIKGRYLVADKKYDEAVAMFNKVAHENPYLYYAEFLKGKMYFENGQYDSAYKYAIIAFDNRPRNIAYFGLLAFACSYKNDSITLKKGFNTFRKYRNDPLTAAAWNNYLYGLSVMKYPASYMLKVADSALTLFPTDSVTINNSKAMHQMAGDKNPVAQNTNSNIPPQAFLQQNGVQLQANAAAPQGNLKDSAIFYDVFKKGNEAFIKSDLKKAIDLYEKALQINPGFYAAIENIGLSHFLLQDYGTAVKYLDMAIATKGALDGKAEYYRGIALIDMGKRDEGCQSFLISESKKYYDARRLYDLNCKPAETQPPTNQ